MKKFNFKKISVVALNESQISMIKGGAEADVPVDESEAAKTRKVACCSCCKGTSCNTKKNSYAEDGSLMD